MRFVRVFSEESVSVFLQEVCKGIILHHAVPNRSYNGILSGVARCRWRSDRGRRVANGMNDATNFAYQVLD